METFNIGSFAELACLYLPDHCIKLTDEDNMILADILSVCNIARLNTSDVCDNVYTFLLKGDSTFAQESYEGKTEIFGVNDNIWKVSIFEYRDCSATYRGIRICSACRTLAWQIALTGWSSVIEPMNHSKYIDHVTISGLLRQIYAKVACILASKKTIDTYNASLDTLVPDNQKTYYISRYKLENLQVLPDMAREDKLAIKTILLSHIDDDKIYKEWGFGSLAISPESFIKVWVTAYAYGKGIDFEHNYEGKIPRDEYVNFFALHNSKGHELADQLKSEEDFHDPSILEKWIECNSMFHCMDVVYARTHISLYGNIFVYSNSTSFYIDEFLQSLLAMEKVCGGTLCIMDADMYIKMIDGADIIKYVPHNCADKYLRNYGGDIYQECSYAPEYTDDIKSLCDHGVVNEFCDPIVSDRQNVANKILKRK